MMAVEDLEMARTCDDCRDRDARVRCFTCFQAERIEARAQPVEECSDSPSGDEPGGGEGSGGTLSERLNDGQIAHRRAMLTHLTYTLNQSPHSATS